MCWQGPHRTKKLCSVPSSASNGCDFGHSPTRRWDCFFICKVKKRDDLGGKKNNPVDPLLEHFQPPPPPPLPSQLVERTSSVVGRGAEFQLHLEPLHIERCGYMKRPHGKIPLTQCVSVFQVVIIFSLERGLNGWLRKVSAAP